MVNPADRGKGAIADKPDLRDYRLDVVGAAVLLPPIFSVRQYIKNIKDQGSSLSCGGQAFSYYAEVLTSIRDGAFTPLSAKDPYSNVYIPGLGSGARDLLKFLLGNGIALESDVPSYPNSEANLESIQASWMAGVRDRAFQQWFSSYTTFSSTDINQVKQAIYQGNGAVIAVRGNNVGWTTANGVVTPPADIITTWGHFLLLTGFSDVTQQIEFVNSWGTDWGDKGFGYMPYSYLQQGWGSSEWTLVELPAQQHALMIRVITIAKNLIDLLKRKGQH